MSAPIRRCRVHSRCRRHHRPPRPLRRPLRPPESKVRAACQKSNQRMHAHLTTAASAAHRRCHCLHAAPARSPCHARPNPPRPRRARSRVRRRRAASEPLKVKVPLSPIDRAPAGRCSSRCGVRAPSQVHTGRQGRRERVQRCSCCARSARDRGRWPWCGCLALGDALHFRVPVRRVWRLPSRIGPRYCDRLGALAVRRRVQLGLGWPGDGGRSRWGRPGQCGQCVRRSGARFTFSRPHTRVNRYSLDCVLVCMHQTISRIIEIQPPICVTALVPGSCYVLFVSNRGVECRKPRLQSFCVLASGNHRTTHYQANGQRGAA